MRQYLKYIKPYILYFIVGPLLMLTEVAGEVLMPYFLAQIINHGIPAGSTGYVIGMGACMVLTALAMMGGGVGGNYFSAKASASFAADLRSDLFKKVQSFSFANIDKFSTGSLVTRLTNDITQIQNMLRMGMIMMLRAPGMMIGAIIMAITINSRLALIVAIVMPFLGFAIGYIIIHAFPKFQAMQKKIDALNSSIQENLTNVRVVKSFVREKDEEAKFRKANKDLCDTALSAFHIVVFQWPVMMIAMNFTTLAIVWFGGNQVINGTMPLGDLTAFTTYIGQILFSLMMVAMLMLNASRAMASSKRIKEVLNTEVDLTDETAARKDAEVTEGKIEFKDVSFRYYKNTSEWVLKKLNFTINPGDVVGIIGSTGSGKTSLVQLIPRLYDTDEGEVLVDGINVKDYDLEKLRTGVGMVLQKNVLFSGTIEENLLWGDNTADDETIQEFAKHAQAHDFITSFPEGYQTELGQGGVNVSGGQKQRLCIARALLKDAPIILLDEATASLDAENETEIQQAISRLVKQKTVLIIAHRMRTVENANKIVVLAGGTVAEMGTPMELAKQNGTFARMVKLQTESQNWSLA